jgi:hypothetical protein
MRHEEIYRVAGREFRPQELTLIREVVASCSGLSRAELANTVCELLDWRRPSGSLKGVECRELLERLEACGSLELPDKRKRRPRGSRTRVPVTERGDPPGRVVEGSVGEFRPILVEPVREQQQRLLYRELVGRHHYLGHAVPYGAHLQYLIWISKPERLVVGALQFSSPAWRMSARDQWIGWDDATRARNLQRVVNNSRFLILPWVRIRNLASTVLSVAASRLVADWPGRYGVEPLLVETLVDRERFAGTCYRAANWIELGTTAGRGRMDRKHLKHGLAPKQLLVYPLVRDAARRLREP